MFKTITIIDFDIFIETNAEKADIDKVLKT
jgi:hypothetical protein